MPNKMPAAMRYLLMPTYGRYLRLRYRVTCTGTEHILPFEGPCLVLSNHVHTMDPFMVSSAYPYHIRWVAGAYLFKNKFLSFILRKWVQSIPKQQGRSDLQTIKNIAAALKAGQIVGLFPEGTRTWDGDTLDIIDGTAKLIKIFKVPVVFLNLEGAYGLKPRWTDIARKGGMNIRIFPVLTPEAIEQMSTEELTQLVASQLSYSHDTWEETHHIPFPSKAQAQGLQRIIYICPCCHAMSSFQSSGDELTCSKCGASITLDAFDRPHTGNPTADGCKIEFDRIHTWRMWQKDFLAQKLLTLQPDELVFPEDTGIFFLKGIKNRFKKLETEFTFFATPTAMTVCGKKEQVRFEFSQIQSLIINTKQTMEFYHNDVLYRIRLDQESSAVKYQELYTIAKGD